MAKNAKKSSKISMLKIDLHLHAKEDKVDSISYSAKQLIDKAKKLNFDALAFTFHKNFFWSKKINSYAKKKGIILIHGAKLRKKGKDVLVYNIKKHEISKIKTLNDLRILKKENKDIFVIAPHPFFKTSECLGKKLEKNIDIFDAIEYSWFFSNVLNLNKKAIKISKKYNKPLIATSDCHKIEYFGKNYCLIKSKRDIKSIFQSIKENKIVNHSNPISLFSFMANTIRIIAEPIFKQKTKNNKYT
ncbi:MAG: PHP-associated domain-containing protein [Candidatus Woesearchaeota archaeon]